MEWLLLHAVAPTANVDCHVFVESDDSSQLAKQKLWQIAIQHGSLALEMSRGRVRHVTWLQVVVFSIQ